MSLLAVALEDGECYEMARENFLKWTRFAEDHGYCIGGLLPCLYMSYVVGSQDVIASCGKSAQCCSQV